MSFTKSCWGRPWVEREDQGPDTPPGVNISSVSSGIFQSSTGTFKSNSLTKSKNYIGS